MRVAYLHRIFPGPLGPLVGFLATTGQHSTIFLAEKWAKSMHIEGVRKARIPSSEEANPESKFDTRPERRAGGLPESRMAHLMRNAAKAGDVLLHLRKGGFVPDVVYGTADDGYLLYAKEIFPKARLVVHLSWLYEREGQADSTAESTAKSDKSISVPMASMLGRVYNCFPLSALNDCDMAIASSAWQMRPFSSAIGAERIRVIKSGVDTRLFRPAEPASSTPAHSDDMVTFSCQGDNPARGIGVICESLPLLLALRPRCRVRLLSFAPTRAEATRQQHAESLAALLPSAMPEEQRRRVEIVVSPSQKEYVALLQDSSVYVYLTSPSMLSAGILEAMSCGASVIASDTGPVSELIHHGENGYLCAAHSGACLAQSVVEALERPALAMGRHARESILREHDLRKLLPYHANLLFGLDGGA